MGGHQGVKTRAPVFAEAATSTERTQFEPRHARQDHIVSFRLAAANTNLQLQVCLGGFGGCVHLPRLLQAGLQPRRVVALLLLLPLLHRQQPPQLGHLSILGHLQALLLLPGIGQALHLRGVQGDRRGKMRGRG